MEKNEIKIDINQLNEDELKQLSEILFRYGYMKECKECNERRMFILN